MNDKPETLEQFFIDKYVTLEEKYNEYKNRNEKLEEVIKSCRLVLNKLNYKDDGINLLIENVFRCEEREEITKALEYLRITIV